MDKKTVFLLIFFCFAMGCSMKKEKSSYEKVMSVIDQYSKSLKKEKGIWNTSYGLFYAGPDKIYDGKIHVIGLGYAIDKHMQYDEARSYVYSVVNGLLDHINNHPELENYFFHYPVDYSDLEFHFSLDYHLTSNLKKEEVDSIHINRNEISYHIVNEEGPCEIDYEKMSPDVYIMKKIPERIRFIRRSIEEDLAMHSR